MDDENEDLFLEFARKIDSVGDAKKVAEPATVTRRPTSKLEEVIDNYVDVVMAEEARRAIAKSEIEAYRTYISGIVKGQGLGNSFNVTLTGSRNAIEVIGKPAIKWDQKLLREMDVDDTPPAELSVTYKPKAAHVDDPKFAPAKAETGTRISIEVAKAVVS